MGECQKGNLSSINIKQKRCIRLITNSKSTDHTKPILKKYNLLKLEDIVRLRTTCIMKKYNKPDGPKCIKDIFEATVTNKDHHLTRAKTQEKLKHTWETSKTIKSMGPIYWNELKDTERNANIDSFKTLVKLRLIKAY